MSAVDWESVGCEVGMELGLCGVRVVVTRVYTEGEFGQYPRADVRELWACGALGAMASVPTYELELL